MKLVIALVLVTILAVVSASPANVLDVQGTYESMFKVVQILEAQVKSLKDAIQNLDSAVDQSKQTRDIAEGFACVAHGKEEKARAARDAAKQVFDAKTAALNAANANADKTTSDLSLAFDNVADAEATYHRRETTYKTATNIAAIEVDKKNHEIEEFRKILALFGIQNGGAI
jgi:hypothetical protein